MMSRGWANEFEDPHSVIVHGTLVLLDIVITFMAPSTVFRGCSIRVLTDSEGNMDMDNLEK